MAVEIDHYAVLGLDRECTIEQVRRAYRVLAKRYHPDVNHGSTEAAERCREVNAAHEVLSDAARRRAYDRERDAKPSASPRKMGREGKIERNISQDTLVKLADFLRGTTLDVRVQDPANPHGAEVYRLEIPAGTAPGTRFRLERSEPFAGGHVQFRVKPMPGGRLKVRGSDVRCDLRITARRAKEGGMETVTGVTGMPVRVLIPRGVGRGEVVRVPGEGLPKPRGGRGDLLARIMYRVEVRVGREGGVRF
jgi:curved DNA-binding protein